MMGKRKRIHEAGLERNQGKKNGMADELKQKKGGELGVKKKPSPWTSAQEIICLDELVKLAKVNNSQPLDNSSINWEQLAITVGVRLDRSLSRTQIYEKVRRLKEKYIRIRENISDQKFNSFKDKDDEKMYKLSGKVWGIRGASQVQKDDEEHDLPSGNLEKGQHGASQVQKDKEEHDLPSGNLEKGQRDRMITHSHDSLSDDSEVKSTQEEHVPLLHPKEPEQQLDDEGNGKCAKTVAFRRRPKGSYKQASSEAGCTSHEQASNDAGNTSHELGYNDADNDFHEQTKPNEKIASQLKNQGNEEEVIKRTAKVFHSEHQALLNNIRESCMTVVQDMQAKFSTLLSNTVRRSESPWMGVGALLPSPGLMLQDRVAGDKWTDRCQSLTDVNESVASKSLSQEWLQQHLQELKLTSLKLQLMLDECKKEKEKLEKQVLKA